MTLLIGAVAAFSLLLGIFLGWTAAGRRMRRLQRRLSSHKTKLSRALDLAQHDGLTQLWNRSAFDDRLADQLRAAQQTGLPVTLMLIDLDHLKQVNDEFGHPAGDAALKMIAAALIRCCRDGDCVARLGGDEFGLILSRADVQGARIVAQRVLSRLATVMPWEQREISLSVSIGAATSGGGDTTGADTAGSDTADELLRRADAALYQSKRLGGGQASVAE